MASTLQNEFEFFLKHQQEFARLYAGKFVVIKDRKVLGAFESEIEAVRVTSERHALGTFIVQKCTGDSGSVTQTFHSRVAFA